MKGSTNAINQRDRIVSPDGTAEMIISDGQSVRLRDTNVSSHIGTLFLEKNGTSNNFVMQSYQSADNWAGLYLRMTDDGTASVIVVKYHNGTVDSRQIISF